MATNIDIQGLRDPSCPPTKGTQVEMWPIDRFVFYARNPCKNDAAVDWMCASIREFGFKVPVLARSDGTVVDGHLRLEGCAQVGIVARRRHGVETKSMVVQTIEGLLKQSTGIKIGEFVLQGCSIRHLVKQILKFILG